MMSEFQSNKVRTIDALIVDNERFCKEQAANIAELVKLGADTAILEAKMFAAIDTLWLLREERWRHGKSQRSEALQRGSSSAEPLHR